MKQIIIEIKNELENDVNGLLEFLEFDHWNFKLKDFDKEEDSIIVPENVNETIKPSYPLGRCNNCFKYYHDEVTICINCNTDKYLMDMPELKLIPDLLSSLEDCTEQLRLFLELHEDDEDAPPILEEAYKVLKKAESN